MMQRHLTAMCYEMRLLKNRWAVWDTRANAPAIVEAHGQTALSMDHAEDSTDLLDGQWR
jgi:hypothetical protein